MCVVNEQNIYYNFDNKSVLILACDWEFFPND